jgi:predicted AAA+ superfamily ATPase
MIAPALQQTIQKRLAESPRAIPVVGPRRSGKATLIQTLINNQEHLFLDGDDPTVRDVLTDINTEKLRQLIGSNPVIFIDEAQRIPNIGLTLKLITDQFKGVQLFVSGSSAFELNQQLLEPLTGRKWEFRLFPVSWAEFQAHFGY